MPSKTCNKVSQYSSITYLEPAFPMKKAPPFVNCIATPQLMTFKHPPHHKYGNYYKAPYTDPLYH